jgi:alkanesulfonate monooxygenase SsuD/methylene tetrahydromethanopterin reductase-like flavin-dependent oxidoreductase (luciferase family)
VNPWPRPLQQPHPPIWPPSRGSGETIDWAAKNRYTYLQTYSDIGTVRRVFDGVRAAAAGYGYEAPPEQIGWAVPVFVAARAEAIALPPLDTLGQFGSLGHEDFAESLGLFADKVLPSVRGLP